MAKRGSSCNLAQKSANTAFIVVFASTIPFGNLLRISGTSARWFFTDDAAKDRFADVARLLAVAHDASALVLIAEAWASLPDARGHIDAETPPSKSPTRQEIVALMLEDGTRQGSMLIPIVRGWNEAFVGFGDTAPVVYGQSEGRFSGMMPPRKPGPEDRAKASALLKALGLNIANRGFDPKLN